MTGSDLLPLSMVLHPTQEQSLHRDVRLVFRSHSLSQQRPTSLLVPSPPAFRFSSVVLILPMGRGHLLLQGFGFGDAENGLEYVSLPFPITLSTILPVLK